ncbi:MAG TPA: hypothetical protein VJJ22_03125 [Candidatus Paceibacterota bacterium]
MIEGAPNLDENEIEIPVITEEDVDTMFDNLAPEVPKQPVAEIGVPHDKKSVLEMQLEELNRKISVAKGNIKRGQGTMGSTIGSQIKALGRQKDNLLKEANKTSRGISGLV